MINKILQVNISPDNNYPILIDDDNINNLEEKILKHTNANKFLIIISQKVEKLYGKYFNFKNVFKFVLKDGENEKNFKNYNKILEFALSKKLERKDAIIAIGGGVVGDLSGFVASTYLRGIDFIQIPTTLLACVDSSVGGKTAINTKFGKNLVGTFYQPKAVFCNINFLKTLDDRQFKTGLAEIIKYAFIEKSCNSSTEFNFYEYLKDNINAIFNKNPEVISEIIKISLSLKIAVVTQDEKESGLRKILNFGHTYGHAIENITKYKKYTHGEAVAMGMEYAFKLAFSKSIITDEYKNNSIQFIKGFKIYNEIPKFDIHKMIGIMKSDKKVKDGKINFILPSCNFHVNCLEVKEDELSI